MIVRIDASQLGNALRAERRDVRTATELAARRSAQRYKAHLVNESDRLGVTDRGLYKNAWRVIAVPGGATLFNDSPHGGIVEAGARPHPVSKEGINNIARWCVRKLGLPRGEAMAAAQAIAKHIERYGQKGTWIVRNSLGVARRFFGEELVRILNSRPSNARGRR